MNYKDDIYLNWQTLLKSWTSSGVREHQCHKCNNFLIMAKKLFGKVRGWPDNNKLTAVITRHSNKLNEKNEKKNHYQYKKIKTPQLWSLIKLKKKNGNDRKKNSSEIWVPVWATVFQKQPWDSRQKHAHSRCPKEKGWH